jgi:hypothetical protein
VFITKAVIIVFEFITVPLVFLIIKRKLEESFKPLRKPWIVALSWSG